MPSVSPAVAHVRVSLDRPPAERWDCLKSHADAARQVVAAAAAPFLGVPDVLARLERFGEDHLGQDARAELGGIARLLDLPFDRLLLANLAYDALRGQTFGCTAFAVETAEGPLHARNLDWGEGQALREHTTVFDGVEGDAVRCSIVGWPGVIGAFTGVAPGRLSVSLNAVCSADAAEGAQPVVLLLRQLLEQATYDEAVLVLSTTALPCDCLLLVCGAEPGQRCVIERTPRRAAVRRPNRGGPLVVTNEYESLRAEAQPFGDGELAATACARYQRVSTLLWQDPAADPFAVLDDALVRLPGTAQQVVMAPRTGRLEVRRPA